MKFTMFPIFKHPVKCFPEHSNVVHHLISEFFLHIIIPLNPINNTVKQMFRLHLTDEEMEAETLSDKGYKGVKWWNWDIHTRVPYFKT